MNLNTNYYHHYYVEHDNVEQRMAPYIGEVPNPNEFYNEKRIY
jgi:hypothetical protein